MVVSAIGTCTPRRKIEDAVFTPLRAPVIDQNPVDSPAVSGANIDGRDVAQPATDLGDSADRRVFKSQRGDGTLRIGGGVGVPGVATQSSGQSADQFKVAGARNYFGLPKDVRDATQAEMLKHPQSSVPYKALTKLAASDGFLAHSPAVEKAMVAAIGANPKSKTFHDDLYALAHNANFTALPEAEKKTIVDSFAKLGGDADGRRVFAEMIDQPGFRLTDPKARITLVEQASAKGYFGNEARRLMNGSLKNPPLMGAEPAEQARLFELIADKDLLKPKVIHLEQKHIDGKQVAFTKSDPKDVRNHDFLFARRNAVKVNLTFEGGQTIPVYIAKNPDRGLHQPTIDEIGAALAALPKEARALVKRVDVQSHAHPDEGRKVGGYQSRVGMSASHAGTVDVYPQPERDSLPSMVGTLTHETGHIISQQEWGAYDNDSRWKAWKAAQAADGPSPSLYGATAMQEDFGETWELYFKVRGTPDEQAARDQFKNRFALIDALVAKRDKAQKI